ncbi:hypothetical protein [Streptomyces sp. NPDC051662]|uniref:hypothetical protein n=1 Tax=Streptomyces sp. NPDC051662 TaxID=3154750 RepID=UPI00342A5ACC
MSGSAIEGAEGRGWLLLRREVGAVAGNRVIISMTGGHRLAHRAVPGERAVVEPFRDR